MIIRKYDNSRDQEACLRMFSEAGWVPMESSDEGKQIALDFLSAEDSFVLEIRGSAESVSSSKHGKLRYLDEEIDFAAISCVCTSRIARKLNSATDLVTKTIINLAENGAAVCGLGFFEQGFYNRLGFGNNHYEYWVKFDPNNLNIDRKFDIPYRLEKKDYENIHKSLNNRLVKHGRCIINSSTHTRLFMELPENSFGLGYYNEQDELTHFIWSGSKGENGPYKIWMMAYETYDQFLELLALMKSLGDQVFAMEMRTPVDIQFQDFLKKPFRLNSITDKTEYENNMWSVAYTQTRVLDLEKCISKTKLYFNGPKFNLKLSDPIEKYLPDDSKWKGIGGDYIVSLGKDSECKVGRDENLLTLKASVGAFTRMWLGVRSATALSVTDEISGPKELLDQLDIALRLPVPSPGMEY